MPWPVALYSQWVGDSSVFFFHFCRVEGRAFSNPLPWRRGWWERAGLSSGMVLAVDSAGGRSGGAGSLRESIAGTQRPGGGMVPLFLQRRRCRRWLVSYPPSSGGMIHCGWRLPRALRLAYMYISEKVHGDKHGDKSYSRGAPRAAQARALIRSAE